MRQSAYTPAAIRARKVAARRANRDTFEYETVPEPTFRTHPRDCKHSCTFVPGLNSNPRVFDRYCSDCGRLTQRDKPDDRAFEQWQAEEMVQPRRAVCLADYAAPGSYR